MYCTNCFKAVHEVGYDCGEGGEETQYGDCGCGKIGAIVFPFRGGVILCGGRSHARRTRALPVQPRTAVPRKEQNMSNIVPNENLVWKKGFPAEVGLYWIYDLEQRETLLVNYNGVHGTSFFSTEQPRRQIYNNIMTRNIRHAYLGNATEVTTQELSEAPIPDPPAAFCVCPFCGKDGNVQYRVSRHHGAQYKIGCSTIGCHGNVARSPLYLGKVEASKAWNKRAK